MIVDQWQAYLPWHDQFRVLPSCVRLHEAQSLFQELRYLSDDVACPMDQVIK